MSPPHPPPPLSPGAAALRIALAYLGLAGLWILVSDRLVAAAAPPEVRSVLHTVKGGAFVLVTALLLFAAIRAELKTRQGSEEAAREAKRRLETLMANFPGVVFRWRDAPGWPAEFVSDGCVELTGVPPEDLLEGRLRYADLIHEADRERVEAEVRRALDEGRSYVTTYRLVRGDGRERWVWEQGCGVPDPSGGGRAIEGVVTDITATKELERQLVHAQKMEAVGRLATGVAHDFNNLLSVIIGYGELLSIRLGDEAEPGIREQVDAIRTAGERAAVLTRRLLAFSRREAPHRRVVDVNEVLSGLDKLLQRLIGEDIQVEVRTAPAPAWAMVDPSQLEQVLMNLAVNARDAMPQGGRLALEVDRVAAEGAGPPDVVVRVTDTGTGMDPETAERIFEPFFTTKATGQGTGLGLSIVYALVQQNEGRVEVRSRPGEGTTFAVTLPGVAAPGSDEAAASEAGVPPAKAAETVLVVDDDSDIRALVRSVLEEAGFAVVSAADGREALAVAAERDEPIDLLVTDLVMPHVDGRELARRLREQAPGLRTVFMSGYDRVLPEEGAEAEPVVLIEKPFTPSELAQRLRSLLLDRQPSPDGRRR